MNAEYRTSNEESTMRPEHMEAYRPLGGRSVVDQWVTLAIACVGITGIGILLTVTGWPLIQLIGWIFIIGGLGAYADFIIGAYRYSREGATPEVGPKLERYVIRRIERVWWWLSHPVYRHDLGGEACLARPVYDGDWSFIEIYRRDGRYDGTAQEIDWSATDMDWEPGEPQEIEIIRKPAEGTRWLPFIARRRTDPKLLNAA